MSLLFAGLGGTSPDSMSGCMVVCAVMVVIAVVHILYTATIRPQADWVEFVLALINAVIIVLNASLSLIGLLREEEEGGGVGTVLGVTLLVSEVYFMVQLVVLCIAGWIEHRRNQATAGTGDGGSASASDATDDGTSVALLSLPSTTRTDPHNRQRQANPLLQS